MKITLNTSRFSLWQPKIQIFKEMDVIIKYTSSFKIDTRGYEIEKKVTPLKWKLKMKSTYLL